MVEVVPLAISRGYPDGFFVKRVRPALIVKALKRHTFAFVFSVHSRNRLILEESVPGITFIPSIRFPFNASCPYCEKSGPGFHELIATAQQKRGKIIPVVWGESIICDHLGMPHHELQGGEEVVMDLRTISIKISWDGMDESKYYP